MPELLYPYQKNAQIWMCPSDKSNYQAFEEGGIRCNYGYNQSRFINRTNFDSGVVSLAQLEDAVGTIIFIDDTNLYAGPYSPAVPVGYNPAQGVLNDLNDLTSTRAANRHNDMYNIAFADGHVKSQKDTFYRNWSYWMD